MTTALDHIAALSKTLQEMQGLVQQVGRPQPSPEERKVIEALLEELNKPPRLGWWRIARNFIAWAVLRCLFPKTLAGVPSAMLLLGHAGSPSQPFDPAHPFARPGIARLDIHPAHPTPQRPSLSTDLGSRVVLVRSPVKQAPSHPAQAAGPAAASKP